MVNLILGIAVALIVNVNSDVAATLIHQMLEFLGVKINESNVILKKRRVTKLYFCRLDNLLCRLLGSLLGRSLWLVIEIENCFKCFPTFWRHIAPNATSFDYIVKAVATTELRNCFVRSNMAENSRKPKLNHAMLTIEIVSEDIEATSKIEPDFTCKTEEFFIVSLNKLTDKFVSNFLSAIIQEKNVLVLLNKVDDMRLLFCNVKESLRHSLFFLCLMFLFDV